MADVKKASYRFDGIEVDTLSLRVTVGGEIRPLEPKSFRLLQFLVENPGKALTKDEIMAVVWASTFVSDNSLARSIAQIRKALDDDSRSPRYIETVPSIGYRFIGELEPEHPPVIDQGSAISPVESEIRVARRTRMPLRWLLGACIASAVTIGILGVVSRRSGVNTFPLHVTRVSKLTSYPGDERDPAISPDGSYVAFSWSGPKADNYDIYIVQSGGQPPLRLTRDPAGDSFPAWSPDGHQISFIRRTGERAEIVVIPALGGPERPLYQFSRIGADLDFTQHPMLSWSPDGKSIVFSGQSEAGKKYQLFALSVETGKVWAITSPNTDVSGDSSPALSADARMLAFVRYLAPRNGRILLQDLDSGMAPFGESREVPSSGLAVHSPNWLADGKQLLFADSANIFEWDSKQGTKQIYAAGGSVGGMSAGPQIGGSRQVVVANRKNDADIWEIPLDASATKPAGPPQVLFRSTEWDSHPDFSPDGKHIAFVSTRSGAPEVWVCDADGSSPRQLTHLGAHIASYPKWSPDGTRIAFHARVPDVAEVYVVALNQGVPHQVTHENPGLALATWSNDGKFLYASTLVGGTAVTFRFPADGGPLERMWQGDLVRESVDGKYVLYRKSNTPGIFRRSLDGNPARNPEQLLVSDFWPNNQLGGYAPVAGGIYYVSGNSQGMAGPFRYFDYVSRKSIDVAPAVTGLEKGFTISPDNRRMLFAASAEIDGDLLLLELR